MIPTSAILDVLRFEPVRLLHRKGVLVMFAGVVGAFGLAAKGGVWLHGKFLEEGGMAAGAVQGAAAAVLDYPAHLPPALAGCLLASAFFLPLVVIILASDQTATDLQQRHAPFILARVSPADFFFGRLVGTTLTWAFVVLISSIVAVIIMLTESAGLGLQEAIQGIAHIAFVLTLYALPWIALLALGNVLTQSPMGSMIGVFCLLIAISWIGAAEESLGAWVTYVEMLYPSHWRPMLVSGNSELFAEAAAGSLIYTAFIALVGSWRLGRVTP